MLRSRGNVRRLHDAARPAPLDRAAITTLRCRRTTIRADATGRPPTITAPTPAGSGSNRHTPRQRRRRSVTNAKPLSDRWNDPATCPEAYCCGSTRLPWDHRMASGRTLWDELVRHLRVGRRRRPLDGSGMAGARRTGGRRAPPAVAREAPAPDGGRRGVARPDSSGTSASFSGKVRRRARRGLPGRERRRDACATGKGGAGVSPALLATRRRLMGRLHAEAARPGEVRLRDGRHRHGTSSSSR